MGAIISRARIVYPIDGAFWLGTDGLSVKTDRPITPFKPETMIEYHKCTEKYNVVSKECIFLDRRSDKCFESQVKYYLKYEKDEVLSVEEYKVVLIHYATGRMIFHMDIGGDIHMPAPLYSCVTRHEVLDILRNYKEEFRKLIKQKPSETSIRTLFYLLFGLKETLETITTETRILSLHATDGTKKVLELEEYEGITELYLSNEFVLLTIPNSLRFVRFSGHPTTIPDCLQKKGFDKFHIDDNTIFEKE